MPAPDIVTEKHRAKLAKMRPNSGHAKVLRGKLGVDASETASSPVPVPVPAQKPKKKRSLFGKKD